MKINLYLDVRQNGKGKNEIEGIIMRNYKYYLIDNCKKFNMTDLKNLVRNKDWKTLLRDNWGNEIASFYKDNNTYTTIEVDIKKSDFWTSEIDIINKNYKENLENE